MKPRIYDSFAEQKLDQRIGFIAFPIVNLLVWLVAGLLSGRVNPFDRSSVASSLRLAVDMLPWAANGLLLLWAFIFRRQIGVGYLIACVGFAATGVGLGLIAVVVSFVSVPLLALAGLVGLVVFFGLALAGSIWFLVKMFGLLKRWWAI